MCVVKYVRVVGWMYELKWECGVGQVLSGLVCGG
jgi:hypothetical protein